MLKTVLLTMAWYMAAITLGEFLADLTTRPYLVGAVVGGLAVMVRFHFFPNFFEEPSHER